MSGCVPSRGQKGKSLLPLCNQQVKMVILASSVTLIQSPTSHFLSLTKIFYCSCLCPWSRSCCFDLLTHVQLFPTPWTCSPPGSSLHGDSPGRNAGVGCYAPPQGDLPKPVIKPRSPTLQVGSLPSELPGKPQDCLLMLYSVKFLNN